MNNHVYVIMVFTVFILLMGLETSCNGLRLLHLRIPAHKLQAGTANLRCVFDLQNSTLYSVKWYKDGEEFYRYTPADTPPGQSFPLPGVTVDLEQSSETRVVLRLLTLESSGTYRCEVSTEAPHFLTVSAHSNMLVMELPRDSPHISSLAEVYSEGEPIDINCTSARSKPATTLTWYINEQEVGQITSNSELGPWQTQYRVRQGTDKLEEVTLGLRLAAHRRFLPRRSNVMRLRCTATLGVLQWHAERWSMITQTASASTLHLPVGLLLSMTALRSMTSVLLT